MSSTVKQFEDDVGRIIADNNVSSLAYEVDQCECGLCFSPFQITASLVGKLQGRGVTFYSSSTFKKYLELFQKRTMLAQAEKEASSKLEALLFENEFSSYVEGVDQEEADRFLTTGTTATETSWLIRPSFEDPTKFVVAKRVYKDENWGVKEFIYQIKTTQEKAARLGFKIVGASETYYSGASFIRFWCQSVKDSPAFLTKSDFLDYMKSVGLLH